MFTTALATAWARRSAALGVLVAITLGTALAASTGLLLSVPALGEFIPMFATGTSIAIFISVFVIAGAITVGVDQRGREPALLRAVGASPRQVGSLVMGETLLIAVAGVIAGAAASHVLVDATIAYMRHVEWLPPGDAAPNTRFAWISLVSAVGIGLLVSWVAALPAARRAGRARPVDALRATSVPVRVMTASRTTIGLLALGGGIWMLIAAASASPSAATALAILTPQVLTIAIVALGPWFIAPLIRLAGLPALALSRASGTIALAQLRSAVRRSTSTAGTAIMLLGIFGALLAVPQTLLASEVASNSRQVTADFVVMGLAEGDAKSEAVEGVTLVTLPRLDAVVPLLDPELEPGDREDAIEEHATLLHADLAELTSVVDLTLTSGTLADVSGTQALISSELALEMNSQVGDTIPLRLPDGSRVDVVVAAIGHVPSLVAAQVITSGPLPASAATQEWVAEEALAAASPGTAPAQVSAALESALPGATVLPVAQALATRAAQAERITWISMVLVAGVATLFSVISIANTQAMGARERRADIALLRRTGATPGQVVRVVVWEVSLTIIVGAVLGTALAVFASRSAYELAGLYMVAPVWSVPWGFFAGLGGVALAVALAFAILPLLRSFWSSR